MPTRRDEMKLTFALAIPMLLLLAMCKESQLSEMPRQPVVDGWRQLFNGRNLDNWQHVGPGKFVVENGELRTESGMGLLWYTREQFGNCRIRVVFKTTSAASNSGVFVRIADRPKDEWFAVHHGYEVQICDSQDEYHRTGAVYSLAKTTSLASKPP